MYSVDGVPTRTDQWGCSYPVAQVVEVVPNRRRDETHEQVLALCPYCHDVHQHGRPVGERDVGTRVPGCRSWGAEYYVVEDDDLPRPTYGRQVLYRYWAGEELLYVGVTTDFIKRDRQHRRGARWYGSTDRVTFERYATRSQVLAAETAAIAAEAPTWNVVGNRG